MGLTHMGAMVAGLCGYVDEEYEEFAIESCKNACGRWFPKPPLPDPEPEEPGMSGHAGIEIQNQVVPEPDGTGGEWGDILPTGTVTWTDGLGNQGPPPLL